MNTTQQGTRLLLLVSSLLIAATAFAQLAVEPLFTSDPDNPAHPLSYPEGRAQLVSARVTIMPGTSTGWHRHPVPTFGYLLQGELEVTYADGEERVFHAGESIMEEQHFAHNGHNRGTEPVVLIVYYAGAVGVANTETVEAPRPDDFVLVKELIPELRVELRYFSEANFVGRPVKGYEAEKLYLTRPAALALKAVQQALAAEGLGLKVFDGYRPQAAVDDFMNWAADGQALAMKAIYYPNVDKTALIPEGYIAERSGHSRGSTVDLTLVNLASGEELDMGSPWDFFDPLSWPASAAVTAQQHDNRMRLREAMLSHGFKPYAAEWWHFTLEDEPYPDTYFDFPVH